MNGSLLSDGSCCSQRAFCQRSERKTSEQRQRDRRRKNQTRRLVTDLLVCEHVLRRGVVGLLVTRQRGFGSREVHLVSGQNGRVLTGPQVVEAPPAVVLHPPGFDPTHFNGVNQFGDLQEGKFKQLRDVEGRRGGRGALSGCLLSLSR